jgi:LCP family protein required for cell wall assembly
MARRGTPGSRSARRGRHSAASPGRRRPGTLPTAADGDPGATAPRKAKKRRRRAGERVLRVAVVLVALTLIGASSVYGYLRFRVGQITTIKCKDCAAVADGTPYNVLLVGSDSRAGNAGGASQAFGSAALVGGQRSDTIKILHVDPTTGTARLLSIPRDTYVALSGLPPDSGLSTDNKINAAFNYGPDPLIDTIESTFGIEISHFVIIDFTGVVNLVNSVGGVTLNFPYPVRDDDNGNNNAGLYIPHSGCQALNGNTALALARSRFYQYEVKPGYWDFDGSGDLGRIQRQNVIIESVIDKARSSFNPLTLNAFVGSLVHDVAVDQKMSGSDLLSLAQKYHAFSGSSLQTATLPTTGEYSSVAGDVQVVQEPQAMATISEFLGAQPSESLTPPLTQHGSAVTVPTTTTIAPETPSHTGSSNIAPTTTTTAVPGTGVFNPTPC